MALTLATTWSIDVLIDVVVLMLHLRCDLRPVSVDQLAGENSASVVLDNRLGDFEKFAYPLIDDGVINELTFTPRCDKPASPQACEVCRYPALSDIEPGDQVADVFLAFLKEY